MTEQTPEKVTELIADARFRLAISKDAGIINRLADALEAVTAERDGLQARITERDLLLSCAADAARATASTVDQVMSGLLAISKMQADRDRLHKAITEALGHDPLHGRSEGLHCGGMAPCIHGILRAALDKEGNDDE